MRLEAVGVTVSFGDRKALDRVDFLARAGEVTAIVGPNGSGKTTLLRALSGDISYGGQVWINGDPIEGMSARDHALRRAVLPQSGNVAFPFTVLELVRLGLTAGLATTRIEESDRLVMKAIGRVGLGGYEGRLVQELSGGMKRRVLIAKALSHEPRVLFLDEPTAGVDVELRKDMWDSVADLKKQGVTIILTTHYIEEAEAIADRVGVISKGQLLLVEEKAALMTRMGRKTLRIDLREPLAEVPQSLSDFDLELAGDGLSLSYYYDTKQERTGITTLLAAVADAGIVLRDLATTQSSLEEIFVGLVAEDAA